MQYPAQTPADRLKGTLLVLVWLTLALLLRESWITDRPSLPGDVKVGAHAASGPAPAQPFLPR